MNDTESVATPAVVIESTVSPFAVRARVRWGDVDAAGIVCYGMYLRYFELAESEMFRAAGLPVRVLRDEHALWLVRRHIECDFLSTVSLDDELLIRASVGRIGNTSLGLSFEVENLATGVLTATGRYVLVAVDRDDMRPKPLPGAVRQALRPYQVEE